jgi:hypothetical protein
VLGIRYCFSTVVDRTSTFDLKEAHNQLPSPEPTPFLKAKTSAAPQFLVVINNIKGFNIVKI